MPVAVTSIIWGVATSDHASEANVRGRGGRSYSTAATPLQSNARGSETQHSILSLFLSPTFLSLPLLSLSLSLSLHTWINPMSSNSTLVISGSSDTSGGEPQSKNSSFAGLYELSQSCAPPLMRGPTVLVADFRSGGLAVPVEADRMLPLWPRAGADPMEKASAPDNSRHAAIAVQASLWAQPAPPMRLPCAMRRAIF